MQRDSWASLIETTNQTKFLIGAASAMLVVNAFPARMPYVPKYMLQKAPLSTPLASLQLQDFVSLPISAKSRGMMFGEDVAAAGWTQPVVPE